MHRRDALQQMLKLSVAPAIVSVANLMPLRAEGRLVRLDGQVVRAVRSGDLTQQFLVDEEWRLHFARIEAAMQRQPDTGRFGHYIIDYSIWTDEVLW